MIEQRGQFPIRSISLHGLRVALFVCIVICIHLVHRSAKSALGPVTSIAIEPVTIQDWFPNARKLKALSGTQQLTEVLDANGSSLGFVAQTSPQGDRFIGFSGPTNVLIGFDTDDRIIGLKILASHDTRDHVEQVREDSSYWDAWIGLTWTEAGQRHSVDAVSGATLTSVAIHEAILTRLGSPLPSLRFPDPVRVEEIQGFFETAERLVVDEQQSSLLWIETSSGERLGSIVRSSPFADNVVGYQGPTEVLLIRNKDETLQRILLGRSFDNESYTDYVRDEEYFLTLFSGTTLEELAALDVEEEGVEGVSGATMTSIAVAESMQVAAAAFIEKESNSRETPQRVTSIDWNGAGTIAVVLAGLILGFTSLKSKRWIRFTFQIVLIAYLGLVNGDLISQAMLVGWARYGIPWNAAIGLCCLTAAALLVPIFSKTNLYCSQLCPHGALQQIVKKRVPWQLKMSRRFKRTLGYLPFVILTWCIVVAVGSLPFSLVDIEPFDAWVIQVAGWATITVAVVGLAFSLVVPMGYCRFGCPTGAMLKYLRYHRGSRNWRAADWGAVFLTCLAIVMVML